MDEAERQKYLQAVTRKLVGLTAGCMLLLFVAFYLVDLFSRRTFLVGIVFVAGLIGGFVSMQQRLPTIGLDELRELAGSWPSILLVPINGGIFAMVLMLMFASGIIQGALFPEYKHPEIDPSQLVESFRQWLRNAFPKDGPAIAKLVFWSFVAGFSERFVPQIIRKTTETAEKE
jgi:hypothetical protein